MKKNRLIALVASITLVVVMVLSGCGTEQIEPNPAATATATPTYSGATPTPRVEIQTVEVEKEYKCLNPQGDQLPVEISPLAERLDTIAGKKIYVKQGEADPVIMPALAEILEEDYKNTEWVYYNPESSFGTNTPEAEVLADADAVIRGIGW